MGITNKILWDVIAKYLSDDLSETLYRLPYDMQANYNHCNKDEKYINVMYADRIGVDDKVSFRITHTNKSKLLLQEAEQQAESYSKHCS